MVLAAAENGGAVPVPDRTTCHVVTARNEDDGTSETPREAGVGIDSFGLGRAEGTHSVYII